jgi:hypothetical protein
VTRDGDQRRREITIPGPSGKGAEQDCEGGNSRIKNTGHIDYG